MRSQPLNPTAQPFTPAPPSPPALIPTARDQDPAPSSLAKPAASTSSSRSKRISPIPPKPLHCKFFNVKGGCPTGQTCLFVHERPDSVGPPHAGENQRRKKQLKLEKAAQDKEAAEKKERERIEKERGKVVTKLDEEELKLVRKKIVCKFYVEGYCHRSSSCAYSHSSHPIASTSSNPASINDDSDDSLHCSICIESPSDFGLLSGCSHVFCVECIMNWRRNKKADDEDGGGDSKNKTCPMCRQESHFVTPSSKFYPAGPDKDLVIKRYKDHMKLVSCRYFAETKGRWCPFGDSCFYSHQTDQFAQPTIFNRTVDDSLPIHKRRTRQARSPNDPAARPGGVDLSRLPGWFVGDMDANLLEALMSGLISVSDLPPQLGPLPANAPANPSNPSDDASHSFEFGGDPSSAQPSFSFHL